MDLQTTLPSNRMTTRESPLQPGTPALLDIMIRAEGVELTEQLREAVSKKIGRVRQYAPRAFRARVQFQKERLKPSSEQFRVTVRYELPGNDVIAEHRAHEPQAALDIVSEKIERRLRKRKTARLASRVSRKTPAPRLADLCPNPALPSFGRT